MYLKYKKEGYKGDDYLNKFDFEFVVQSYVLSIPKVEKKYAKIQGNKDTLSS